MHSLSGRRLPNLATRATTSSVLARGSLLLALGLVASACGESADPSTPGTGVSDSGGGLDGSVIFNPTPDGGADGAAQVDVSTDGSGATVDVSTVDGGNVDGGGNGGVCPGGANCPCTENDDCDGGMCLEGPDGNRCAKSCLDACAPGFGCAQVPQGTDVLQVCVSNWARLCSPCEETKDCNHPGVTDARCVSRGQSGNFCGSACSKDGDCPAAYACRNTVDVDGFSVQQCLPVDDKGALEACVCNANAMALAFKTSCSKSVVTGGKELTCAGSAQCKTVGKPTECIGKDPGAEICDGIDNDCDGDTDEESCDDKNPCTNDVCDATKGCTYKMVSDGTGCDADGSVCTLDDACKDGVCTPGTLKNCDDKNPCTKDSCDMATGCTQVADDGVPCDDENPCTIGDVCGDKKCKAGATKECASTEFCVAAKCDLTQGGKCVFTNKKSGAACDDADACTEKDGCDGGTCGGLNVNCDDGNACTTDACDPKTGCTYKAHTGPCDDGDGCTQADSCTNKVCNAGKLKVCDDSEFCTDDSCDSKTGNCTYAGLPKQASACDADGSVCTKADACDSGKCKPGKTITCDDGKVCTTDSCDPKSGCVSSLNTAKCDDNDACTSVDVCSGGTCAGTKLSCDDKNPCTVDTCDKNTGCVAKAVPDETSCGGVGDWCKAGKCVPKTSVGKTCTSAKQCGSGFCVDGVCCESACDAGCLSCSSKLTNGVDGQCKPTKAGIDPNNDCNKMDQSTCGFTGMCSGSGKCATYAAGLVCKAASCVAGGFQATGVCGQSGCVAGKVTSCADGNSCTTDSCDSKSGCSNKINTLNCNDGNACTVSDTCANGACGGTNKSCDDGNPCTKDSCSAINGCGTEVLANGTSCGGANWCQESKCVPKVVCSGSGSKTFTLTGAKAQFIVPKCVKSLNFSVYGAQGGTSSKGSQGGFGARVRGNVAVSEGQVFTLLVGGQGGASPYPCGGGGGSYVVRGVTPLLIAGGGGGGYNTWSQQGHSTVLVSGGASGGGAASKNGGGGGGFSGNGSPNFAGGKSFLSGGAGGSGYPAGSQNVAKGGFGGGGGSSQSGTFNAGGGGGYVGGSAGNGNAAKGGVSFLSPLVTGSSHQGKVWSGNGRITVSW